MTFPGFWWTALPYIVKSSFITGYGGSDDSRSLKHFLKHLNFIVISPSLTFNAVFPLLI